MGSDRRVTVIEIDLIHFKQVVKGEVETESCERGGKGPESVLIHRARTT